MTINNNTDKINELINKINSLPIAGSGAPGADGSDGFSPTIKVEEVDGGHNIIITDINGSQTFFVANGKDGSVGPKGDDGGVGPAGADGSDGVGISSIKQTTTSTTNGGTNVITATLTNGQTSTFNIKNGTRGTTGATGATGPAGADGVGVTNVTQTTTSDEDGGTNVITITLSNGNTYTFNVKNGSKGSTGSTGSNATINGVNALTLNTGNGITKSQSGSTMTIGASLTDILASGPIILKEGTGYHYGNTLPAAGTKGRLFFKKVSS